MFCHFSVNNKPTDFSLVRTLYLTSYLFFIQNQLLFCPHRLVNGKPFPKCQEEKYQKEQNRKWIYSIAHSTPPGVCLIQVCYMMRISITNLSVFAVCINDLILTGIINVERRHTTPEKKSATHHIH